jgi:ferredoxin
LTFVVTDNWIKCTTWIAWKCARSTVSTRARTCSSFTPISALTAVCEPECLAEAIFPDTQAGLESWLKLNADYALAWPNITIKREPPADAKEFDGVPGKFEQYFSSNPGQGD